MSDDVASAAGSVGGGAVSLLDGEIREPPARARRNRRHRRAPLWAPEAVGHVTRRGRGEVGRLRGKR